MEASTASAICKSDRSNDYLLLKARSFENNEVTSFNLKILPEMQYSHSGPYPECVDGPFLGLALTGWAEAVVW